MSDSGVCCASDELTEFLQTRAILHRRTATGHPPTNGQAESAVETLKRVLKRQLTALMWWHDTSNMSTGSTPAEAVKGKRLRGRLDIVLPSNELPKEDKMIENYGGGRSRRMKTRDHVRARGCSNPNRVFWIKAVVVEILGDRHYLCQLESGRLRRRHVGQLILDSPQQTDYQN